MGLCSDVIRDGFAILNGLVDTTKFENLEKELLGSGFFEFSSETSSLNLLKHSEGVGQIIRDRQLRSLIADLSNHTMFPVKAFILDKTVENNWQIPWHQDLKIAVEEKVPVNGYTNWSTEAGVAHVQPPAEVMEQLITLRIHFDPTSEVNGAIHVIPGSHWKGIIHSNDIPEIVQTAQSHLCEMDRFGIMLMKPLILHDSPPSCSSLPRRILQIEFGYELNNGIRWHGL